MGGQIVKGGGIPPDWQANIAFNMKRLLPRERKGVVT